MITFTAEIKIRGVNPYILVSKTRTAKIKSGWRKPMPVLVRINGKPETHWRINMMPIGDGNYYLRPACCRQGETIFNPEPTPPFGRLLGTP